MVEEAVSASAPTIWAVINSWFTPTVFFVVLQFVIATIYITSNIGATSQKQHHQQNPQGDDTQQQQLPRSPLQMLKSINFHSYYTYRSQQPPPEVQNAKAPHSQTHEAAQQQEEHPPQSQIPRSPTTQSINLHNYYHLPTAETDTSIFQTTHEPEKHDLDNDEITETHEQQERHHFHLDDTSTTTTTVEAEETDEEDHKGEEARLGPSLDEVYRRLVEVGQGRHFKRSQSDTTPGSGQEPAKMKKSALSHHWKEDDMVAVENRRPATDEEGVDAKADDFINRFKQQLKLQRFDSVVS